MIGLARISARITGGNAKHAAKHDTDVDERSRFAKDIEVELNAWKSDLPPHLNFDNPNSLQESELIAKQKVVLHLRM